VSTPLFSANSVVKTQHVRLMDIFLLGPFMVFASTLLPERHAGVRTILAVAGIATTLYNWRNYKAVRSIQRRLPVEPRERNGIP
jgi:hypothetical protein